MNGKRAQIRGVLNRIIHYGRGVWYERGAPSDVASSGDASSVAASAAVSSATPPHLPTHAPPSHTSSPHSSLVRDGMPAHADLSAHDDASGDDVQSRHDRLKALYAQIAQCVKCPLHQHRIQTVPGSGVLDPDVMVIGEAPGANEDKYGKPFVGRAGKYLDKWLESIDIYRAQNAYIANIIKCRPPQNRDPVPAEIAHCKPYLERQIRLVRPKVILVAGRIAAHHLFDITDTLARMRVNRYVFQDIPAMVTYHPSAVLRNPNLRRPVWEDLQRLKQLIAER